MKSTNNINTYLAKHNSLITAATLISFRGVITDSNRDHQAAECIKSNTTFRPSNRSSIKK